MVEEREEGREGMEKRRGEGSERDRQQSTCKSCEVTLRRTTTL